MREWEVMRPISFVKFIEIAPTQTLWEEFFGPYPWFFTPTIGELISHGGGRLSNVYYEYKDQFAHLIPPEWHRKYSWGQWDVISQVQFRASLSQDLVRLDKSILTIGTVIAYIVDQINGKKSVTYYDYLDEHDRYQLILPSTFVIDGISRLVRDEDVIKFVMSHTNQRRIVIDEVSRGYAVVEHIASEIVDAARKIGDNRVEMRLIKDRRDGVQGKLVRPVAAQYLDTNKIDKYYNLPNKSKFADILK